MQILIESVDKSQRRPELNDTAQRNSRPDYNRPGEHTSDALLLLDRLRKGARAGEYPSTAELQREGKYGLRPVNRIGDLIKGKHNGTRYDIERLDCSRGVYRWRIHEPSRPGYPKDKRQEVLPLAGDWNGRQTGKPRDAVLPEKPTSGDLPLFGGRCE
jgi:hypothetical protein